MKNHQKTNNKFVGMNKIEHVLKNNWYNKGLNSPKLEGKELIGRQPLAHVFFFSFATVLKRWQRVGKVGL